MIEIKEAVLVKVFKIEGFDYAFRKISKKEADKYPGEAIQALYRSTVCWFISVYRNTDEDEK